MSNDTISTPELKKIAAHIRYNTIDMLVAGESHHIGCALDIIELLTYLYFVFLKVNPKKPDDAQRDIFILSKGHAASALYATLAQKGFFPVSLLQKYDQDGGVLPEHASRVAKGVELSTGSLGHGLPVGVGFALAAKQGKTKRKTVVMMSDGELDEGSNWEAIMFAGHHQLDNLIAIIDKNEMQGYAATQQVLDLAPLAQKFVNFGWEVQEIDGHNFTEMHNAFRSLEKSVHKPKLLIANTIKGKGVAFFEGKFESHYKSITSEQKSEILNELGGKR